MTLPSTGTREPMSPRGLSRLGLPILALALVAGGLGCDPSTTADASDATADGGAAATSTPDAGAAAPDEVPGPILPERASEAPGVAAVFGGPGVGPSSFSYPRAIAFDGRDGGFYVVDRRAWVRRFDAEGRPVSQWQMPEHENGNPRHLKVGRDGNLIVADTHYYRVAVFSPEGVELRAFGERGQDDGKFLFVTGVAEDAATGDVIVCDYGDDVSRVQRFTAEGELLGAMGGLPGEEKGRFQRPMAAAVGADGRVYVADSCNHRIQVLDATLQNVLAVWEGFRYPYDVDVAPDGRVIVAEYGNNRISLLSPDGEPLWTHGRPGRGRDEVATPWGAAFVPGGDRALVTDSGNHRLVVLELP